MHQKYALLTICIICFLLLSFLPEKKIWKGSDSLYELLRELGEATPDHAMDPQKIEDLALKGEELVKVGRAVGPNGKMSRFISKYYTCTTCHNLVQEDPDLRKSDPEARLTYAKEKGLPFLQATTFKGIVNRETWYNDDYVKKYGDLVIKANKSLAESTQLCAVECSQGRPLELWELDAIMAYYWSLEFTLDDLDLPGSVFAKINDNEGANPGLLAEIKSYYLQKSPASFVEPPQDPYKGYGEKGDAARGKLIYDLSCKHCHDQNGASRFILDDTKMTFRKLKRNITKYNDFSLYQIIRRGTYAQPGARPYMPHYTLERMSHKQVEDLRAYVEFGAN